LTANLQLWPRHNPPGVSLRSGPGRAGAAIRSSWFEHRAFLEGSFDREPHCAVLPVRGVVGHGRACRSASDIPRRDRPVRARSLDPTRVGCRQDPPPPSPRQRQRLRRTRDAFPRRVPSPPRSRARPRLAPRPDDGSLHHREPATVPAASPPGAGFEPPLHLRGEQGEPSSCLGARSCLLGFQRMARSDASRRLLQSVQPTSTTTNLPIPGPTRRRSSPSSR
jgi:hypothetical protein